MLEMLQGIGGKWVAAIAGAEKGCSELALKVGLSAVDRPSGNLAIGVCNQRAESV
jgi:hypothetical protein